VALDDFLLKVLVCPESREPVALADDALVARINELIQDKMLRNRGGELVEDKAQGALVREDGRYAYLIRDDIPIMLIDEAVELADVNA
jgi:uncharacterized protein YbaR (Trm112 family)